MDFLDKALLSYQQIEKLEEAKYYELAMVQWPISYLRDTQVAKNWKDGVHISYDTLDPLRRLLGRVLPVWLLSNEGLRYWMTTSELQG